MEPSHKTLLSACDTN